MSGIEKKQVILQKLMNRGYEFNEHVIQAFFEVDRALFVLPENRSIAYQDTPLPIPKKQTISAIHMVLIMLAKGCGDPRPGENVLEVGTGSGYNAALLSKAIHSPHEGRLTTIEYIPEVYEFAKKNLKQAGFLDTMTIILGDGSKGYRQNAPYDLIIVTAAAPQIPPPLIEQLNTPGRLIIPVGKKHSYQELIVIRKTFEGIEKSNLGGVVFVPLRGEHGFQ